jgi:hypothetical protein
MRPAENIKRLIKNAEVNINQDVKKAALDELINELENTQKTSSAVTSPKIGRIIMTRKTTKFAAAAVIIIAVFIGINQFGGSLNMTSVAWAEVTERVLNVRTFVCNRTDLHITPNNSQGIKRRLKIYDSAEYGNRIDSYRNQEIQVSTYTLPLENAIVTVMPSVHKYDRHPLTKEMLREMEQKRPGKIVARFMENEYRHLGHKKIGDIEVEGIEVYDTAVIDGPDIESLVARLWVDVNNELPVLIEIEILLGNGNGEMNIVLDDFKWNVELEKNIFKPNIPEDYKRLNAPEITEDKKTEDPKELTEGQRKEKEKVKEISLDIFQKLANEEMEAFLKYLPHEIINPQIKNYEFLNGLKVVNIKDPYQVNGSSKWIIPYKVKLRDESFREGKLYIGYYEKSRRYVITGGLRQ